MKLRHCPVCGLGSGSSFLKRHGVPVLQNAPQPTPEGARNVLRGDLDMTACVACGFISNSAYESSLVDYSQTYDNTQALSPHFEDYLNRLSEYLVAKYDLRGKRVVEIGCGKGHFLRAVCRTGNNRGLGFDPTYVGPEEVDGGRVRFVREFYGERQALHKADLLCCRHVLEHVADPMSLLRLARTATDDDRDVVVFFEVPDVEWILRNAAFWDFYYEHCSYFGRRSLKYALASAGFEITHVTEAFGGQYLWMEGRPADRPESPEPSCPKSFIQDVQSFSQKSAERVDSCLERIVEFRKAGGCAIWGAGAKGVTLVNIVDPERELVECLIDINPAKQGKFVAGTGHAIVGPRYLEEHHVGGIVVTNPNYLKEVEGDVRRLAKADVLFHCL